MTLTHPSPFIPFLPWTSSKIFKRRILPADGAMGTELFAAGVPRDRCLEELCVSDPELGAARASQLPRGRGAAGENELLRRECGAAGAARAGASRQRDQLDRGATREGSRERSRRSRRGKRRSARPRRATSGSPRQFSSNKSARCSTAARASFCSRPSPTSTSSRIALNAKQPCITAR